MKLTGDRLLDVSVPVPARLRETLALPAEVRYATKLTAVQWRGIRRELGLPVPPASRPVRHEREPLREHQVEALDFGRARSWRYYVAHEPGTGKSRGAIEMAKEAGVLGRTLIVTPLSVFYSWQNELARWGAVTATLCSGPLDRRLAALDRGGPWIMNWEALRSMQRTGREDEYVAPILDKLLGSTRPEALVLDEATAIKGTASLVTKAAWALADGLGPSVPTVLLSGVPAPHDVSDWWAQLRCIQELPLGHRSVYGLRNTHCLVQKTAGGFERVTGVRDPEGLARKLAAIVHRRRLVDCIEMPPLIQVRMPVDLLPVERRAYDDMRRHSVAILTEQQDHGAPRTLLASTAATQLLRLAQITGGAAAKDGWGAKPRALLELMSLEEGPFLVYTWFREEVERLDQRLRAAHYRVRKLYGGTSDAERRDLQAAFDRGEVDVIVGNPGAGGIGINLQRSRRTYYLTNDYNLLHRDQSLRRSWRMGQTEPVVITDLIARDTVDSRVLDSLDGKRSVIEAVLDDPRAFFGGGRT